MKNLTFKIIDNADNNSHNWLGFQKIKVLERVLFRTVHHDSPAPCLEKIGKKKHKKTLTIEYTTMEHTPCIFHLHGIHTLYIPPNMDYTTTSLKIYDLFN